MTAAGWTTITITRRAFDVLQAAALSGNFADHDDVTFLPDGRVIIVVSTDVADVLGDDPSASIEARAGGALN